MVLKKSTMLVDAISHSILPGIVLGYLLAGDRNLVTIVLGASAAGLVAVSGVNLLRNKLAISADSAIGIVYSVMFALGTIMLSMFAGSVDLDQDCVLFGELAFLPLNRLYLPNGVDIGPVDLWILGGNFLLVLAFILRFYNPLLVSTFDGDYLQTLGGKPKAWSFGLLTLVTFTVVTSFQSVGSILVVSLFVAPASAALLLFQSLPKVMLGSVGFGILSVLLGYAVAYQLNISLAGAISTMAGIIFFAVLFAKNYTNLLNTKYLISQNA